MPSQGKQAFLRETPSVSSLTSKQHGVDSFLRARFPGLNIYSIQCRIRKEAFSVHCRFLSKSKILFVCLFTGTVVVFISKSVFHFCFYFVLFGFVWSICLVFEIRSPVAWTSRELLYSCCWLILSMVSSIFFFFLFREETKKNQGFK